ncbi:hypothetical protein NL676_000474 [Syzygium grande]|nr:hypothetical protein NL676_000474 [Syzygium grande]
MAMISGWVDGDDLRSYAQIHEPMVYGFELSWLLTAGIFGYFLLAGIVGGVLGICSFYGIVLIHTCVTVTRTKKTKAMSGGGEPEATRCSTCLVGTPVEPRAHHANQHAATWIAGEAHPASFHSSYMNATPSGSASGFANLNQSGGSGSGENPYVHVAPLNASAPPGRSPMNKICDALSRCGKRFEEASQKAEVLADNVWHHLRTSPNITDAAMARLAQGTKVLTEGGQDKVFQHTFEILPGERLLKAYACYLSTSTGPVIGTLYLSNKRLAFCSDNPLCQYSPSGQQQWMYYKVTFSNLPVIAFTLGLRFQIGKR